MKPIIAASLLVLSLTACGGLSEEDVLTPDRIRASESAPELPDIQLGEEPGASAGAARAGTAGA